MYKIATVPPKFVKAPKPNEKNPKLESPIPKQYISFKLILVENNLDINGAINAPTNAPIVKVKTAIGNLLSNHPNQLILINVGGITCTIEKEIICIKQKPNKIIHIHFF